MELRAIVLMTTVLMFSFGEISMAWEENDEMDNQGNTECASIYEKVEIFTKLHKAVNDDFAMVSDPVLCKSMADQCEHFYNRAVENQEFYQEECDPDYEFQDVPQCSYAENVCEKVKKFKKRAYSGLHAKPKKRGQQKIVLDYVYREDRALEL
jgi:hypothetical protein